jgi:hypothetical protein
MKEKEPQALPTSSVLKYSSRRHQLHLWIGKEEYEFLRTLAGAEDESVARIVRRLIRELRASRQKHDPHHVTEAQGSIRRSGVTWPRLG